MDSFYESAVAVPQGPATDFNAHRGLPDSALGAMISREAGDEGLLFRRTRLM